MLKGYLCNFDKYIYQKLYINNILTFGLKIITSFANTLFLFFIILLLYLFLDKFMALYFFISLLLNAFINQLLKLVLKRERPNINRLINERGYSYPSGHTMNAISFYGLIIYFIIVSPLLIITKLLLVFLLILLIILIGFSRIYLGVHYISDVIGGFLISSGYIIFFIHILQFVL